MNFRFSIFWVINIGGELTGNGPNIYNLLISKVSDFFLNNKVDGDKHLIYSLSAFPRYDYYKNLILSGGARIFCLREAS